MNGYKARNLTPDESAKLMRELHLALGSFKAAETACRIIGEAGLGIFAAEPATAEDYGKPGYIPGPPLVLGKGDRVRDKGTGHEGTVDLVDNGRVRVQFDHGRIGIYDQVDDDQVIRLQGR